jgi:hypothetical protein
MVIPDDQVATGINGRKQTGIFFELYGCTACHKEMQK